MSSGERKRRSEDTLSELIASLMNDDQPESSEDPGSPIPGSAKFDPDQPGSSFYTFDQSPGNSDPKPGPSNYNLNQPGPSGSAGPSQKGISSLLPDASLVEEGAEEETWDSDGWEDMQEEECASRCSENCQSEESCSSVSSRSCSDPECQSESDETESECSQPDVCTSVATQNTMEMDGTQEMGIQAGPLEPQGDEAYLELLEVAKVDMEPRLKRRRVTAIVRPLQQLVLRNVADHLPLFLQMEDPFAELAPTLMGILARSLSEYRGVDELSRPEVVQHLLRPTTEALHLNLMVTEADKRLWTVERVKQLFADIIEKCQENLMELRLKLSLGSSAFGAARPDLLDALSQLHSLHVLELSRCGLTDQDLKVIGANCPQLRELDISANILSEEGVKCVITPVKGAPRKLKVLDLTDPTYDMTLTEYDVLDALRLLPLLLVVKHRKLVPAIQLLAPETPLKLEYLEFNCFTRGICELNREEIEEVVRVVPHTHELVIRTDISDIRPLLKLTEVRRLRFENFMAGRPLTIMDASVKCFGPTLTHIHLETPVNVSVDLSTIGFHCLNVEVLEVLCRTTPDSHYHLNSGSHFTRLREFRTQFRNSFPVRKATLPEDTLEVLVGAPCLVRLSLYSLTFPARAFTNVVRAAKQHAKALLSLEELHLARMKGLTLTALLEVLAMAPRLRTLAVHSTFSTNERMLLYAMVDTHKLDIKVRPGLRESDNIWDCDFIYDNDEPDLNELYE